MDDWYLLKTLTCFEPNACRHICHPAHKGEATYLPTPQSKAYLPGYAFAKLKNLSCLATCFSAKPRLFLVFSHISPEKHIIMRPFMVSNETVEELTAQAQNHAPSEPSPLWQGLVGKKIRIRNGPFMGHLAKIKSISHGIVKLRLYDTMLGKSVQLSMNMEDL